MSGTQNQGTYSSRAYATLSSFSADTDLRSWTSGPANGKACRQIIVTNAGTGTKVLSVIDLAGNTKTLTTNAQTGQVFDVQARGIDSATTVSEILILW